MIKDIKKIDAYMFFAVMACSPEKLLEFSMSYAAAAGSGILMKSGVIDFTQYSSYYNMEMGSGIIKQLFLSDKIIKCHEIGKYKRISNLIESESSKNGCRTVNIDPGYVNTGQVVLATTKYSPHRLPIDAELWAEITLIRHKKSWFPLLWTYKDYASDRFTAFFDEARKLIKEKKA
jgi:hypothetical protein